MINMSELFLILFMVVIFIIQCRILNETPELFENFEVENFEKLEKKVNEDINEIEKEISMGPYDNVKLEEKNKNTPLLNDKEIRDVYGHTVPLKDHKSKNENNDEMFLFSRNKCSPDCCPGTYSCDRGCVCENDDQVDLISRRGGNNHYDNEVGN